jgi:D-alanyl-D-alanine carboxypeptidase
VPLPTGVTAQLADQLAAGVEEYGAPGAVMHVCAPGYEGWSTAVGVADLDAQTPMTADLEWGIRSITKSFTVTLILQLADEGLLSLDDPIDTWVDGIPNGSEVTLRQLAAMTGGVPDYVTQAFVDDFSADPTRDFTIEELIDYARAGEPMFPPGQGHVYANSSTLMLGRVVEEVTGQPFAQALHDRILDPTGLAQTRYPATALDWSGPHPTGYQPGEGGALTTQPDNFTVFGPAGAMTSTAADLCAWATAMGDGELVSDELQAERVEGTPLDEGPEYDIYGLGIGTVNGWTGHTGEGFGTTALAMHDVESGTSAVILMNLSGTGVHAPTRLFREMTPTLASIDPR